MDDLNFCLIRCPGWTMSCLLGFLSSFIFYKFNFGLQAEFVGQSRMHFENIALATRIVQKVYLFSILYSIP